MGLKEKIEFLIGVLKTSTDQKFEEEWKAIEELESVALYTLEKFKGNDTLKVNLTPSKYEDVFTLGIYIDPKTDKVFLKSANIDVDFSILNK